MAPEGPGADTLRVGDEERERTVATLRDHAAKGRLEPEEFDRRLGAALRARTGADLTALLQDLPSERRGANEPAPTSQRHREVARWRRHAAIFAVMSLFFIAVWALSGAGYFWPVWPILGWGIGLAVQRARLIGPPDESDERPSGDGRGTLPPGT